MSADFMVFDPEGAPRSAAAFRKWYFAETEWNDGDAHADPKFASLPLQKWYEAMVVEHPNLNLAPNDEEIGDHWADYTFCRHLIYVSMPPEHAGAAVKLSDSLARQLSLGRYYPMDDDGRSNTCIQIPDGQLEADPPSEARTGFFARLFGSKK